VKIVITKPDKNKIRQKRHRRVRGKLSGTADRPRLNVFRSKKFQKELKQNKPLLLVSSLLNVQLLKVFLKSSSTAVDISITDV